MILTTWCEIGAKIDLWARPISSVTESDVERIFHPKTVPKKTCHKHGERGPNLRLAAIEIGSATAMAFVLLI
jgi:hypothetical protein